MTSPSLWIVATPIGTLEDLSPRAARVLAAADLLLAEDPRRLRALLSHVGIAGGGRLRSLHEHNEARVLPAVLAELHAGRSAALTCDAGTPALSDPGYRLVRAVREAGLGVASVPGPSVFTAALAAAGQPPLPATLVGFLPRRPGPRRRAVTALVALRSTLVVLLSPHRLGQELAELATALGGERPATLLAEVSKLHERAVVGSLGEILLSSEVQEPRGEYVLVIGCSAVDGEPEPDIEAIRQQYRDALAAGQQPRLARAQLSRRLGLSHRRLYSLLVEPGPVGENG
jgi:16S rRNA (cytidine1402-2'-O)-methyltransferase